jgi:pimeloyl-ACP methyl ester carboxylesterase
MEQALVLGDTTFNCYRAGTGPATLIFVHCSGGSHREWRLAKADYSQRFTVIAPDILGYGANPTWNTPTNPYGVDDLDLLRSLIPDGPYHLIGHSYGGILALETARRAFAGSFRPPESLFLIEPPAAYLLRDSAKHWALFQRVSGQCFSAMAQNNDAKAARAFMGFWIGHLPWLLTPRKQKRRLEAAMNKVAFDLNVLATQQTTFTDHAIITCPTTLISGTRSPEIAQTLVKRLCKHLPQARHREIKGAGHMSPYTHPQVVKELLDEHMGWVGYR